MENESYLKIFKASGALLEGHFILTSGRHSSSYFQCAKVLQYPEYLSIFSDKISEKFNSFEVDLVISPAVGGIVIGTDVGQKMKKRSVFAERENGKMTLRRGFSISPGEKVLVVEDVITTGGSVKEVIDLVEDLGGNVIGVGVIVDRSDGRVKLHSDQLSLVALDVVSYHVDNIPENLKLIPVEKPGSRSL